MANTWSQPTFGPLHLKVPGDPEREARLNALPILDAALYSDDGPLMVINGIGHDEQAVLDFATFDDAHNGWWFEPGQGMSAPVLDITADEWMWTPWIKNCEPYGGNGFCDDAGMWRHRHLVPRTGATPLTIVSLMTWSDYSAPETYRQWWERTHPDIPFRTHQVTT